MKRLIFMISIVLLTTFVFSSLSYTNDKIIYGCYKKNNGQLRIVTQSGGCLPSEVPISWNQAGPGGQPGPPGPAGPAGPQGPPGISVESNPLPEGDPNCPSGGTAFRSISGVTYACNGVGGGEGSSLIVRKIPTGVCTNGFGWCPNGYSKWFFQIQDTVINKNSVILLNVSDPNLNDSGCEVGAISEGAFQIYCVGLDYVGNGAFLHYAVFNQ